MECVVCDHKFDAVFRRPFRGFCGHSLCCFCLIGAGDCTICAAKNAFSGATQDKILSDELDSISPDCLAVSVEKVHVVEEGQRFSENPTQNTRPALEDFLFMEGEFDVFDRFLVQDALESLGEANQRLSQFLRSQASSVKVDENVLLLKVCRQKHEYLSCLLIAFGKQTERIEIQVQDIDQSYQSVLLLHSQWISKINNELRKKRAVMCQILAAYAFILAFIVGFFVAKCCL